MRAAAAAARTGASGGSAFPATATVIRGITVTPVADVRTNVGDGRVAISYRLVPAYLTTHAIRNVVLRNLTLQAQLSPGSGPLAGEPVSLTTGSSQLCTATTSQSGQVSCQLTHDQSLEVNSNSGHYTASFAGDGALLSSQADGVGRIFRF